jgi:ElaB/YqjD/DUF883 family membrane-anchored ribosome-binding protein
MNTGRGRSVIARECHYNSSPLLSFVAGLASTTPTSKHGAHGLVFCCWLEPTSNGRRSADIGQSRADRSSRASRQTLAARLARAMKATRESQSGAPAGCSELATDEAENKVEETPWPSQGVSSSPLVINIVSGVVGVVDGHTGLTEVHVLVGYGRPATTVRSSTKR